MEKIDDALAGTRPSVVVLATLAGAVAAYSGAKFIQDPEAFKRSVLGSLMSVAKSIPLVQGVIDKELETVVEGMRKDLHIAGDEKFHVIPEQGWTADQILETMEKLRIAEEPRWKAGKVSGCVYHGGEEHTDIMNKVLAMFSLTNPLHPDVFPSVRKFEAEIASFAANLLNGGNPDVVGSVTSGGSESILLAIKTTRDYFRVKKPWIKEPEMIIPDSAHAAFLKGAQYFGVKLHTVRVGVDFRSDVAAMRKLINQNTILLVGSAPSYPHGIVDNIQELSELALEFDIGMHVDACLGGFILPFLKRNGAEIPDFDFRFPGVTSMSADTHKYGYSVKGSSTLLFKNKEWRRHMYFVITEWAGGIYPSPTMSGSRPGCLIAATWASLMHMGQNGYTEAAKGIMDTYNYIMDRLDNIEGIKSCVRSNTMVVSFMSAEGFDIFMVMDEMTKRGWALNALQRPNSVHLCLTYKHVGKGEIFVSDLTECVAVVRKDPNAKKASGARAYGLAYSLPDRGVVGDVAKAYLDVCLEV